MPKFWKATFFGVVFGFFCFMMAATAAGGGHGSYVPAKVLFPYTMLSTVGGQGITRPFIVLALLQFPLYGMMVGYAWKKGTRLSWLCVGLLFSVHLGAVAIAFELISPAFR